MASDLSRRDKVLAILAFVGGAAWIGFLLYLLVKYGLLNLVGDHQY